MSKYYELITFTASTKDYADPIIDFLDQEHLIRHRLYRQHLTLHNQEAIKDLSKIGRDLSSLIILDNVPQNFILQPENGIFMKSWEGDEDDQIFKLLLPVFESIAKSGSEDVREILVELKRLLLSN